MGFWPDDEWGRQLSDALAELHATEGDFNEAFAAMLAGRPDPARPDVDLSVITKLDPHFDGLAFLAIARESFFVLREAWERRRASIADGLTSPEIMADLQAGIAADTAAGRFHLMPGVEVFDAVITSACVDGGEFTIVVRMRLIGRDFYVDAQGNILSGDMQYHTWDEDWTFWRDPNIDARAEDRAHALMFEEDGGWDFAHNGWDVVKVERVPGAAA